MMFVLVRRTMKNLKMINATVVETAVALTKFLTGLKLASKVDLYGSQAV